MFRFLFLHEGILKSFGKNLSSWILLPTDAWVHFCLPLFPLPLPFFFLFLSFPIAVLVFFSLSHLRVKNLIWDKANQNWYIPFKKMGFDKSDSFKGKLLDHKSSLQPVLYLISEPSLMNGLKTNMCQTCFIRNKLK